MKLTDSITILPGVGGQNAKKLKKLGIFCIWDLVTYFPFRYEDLSKISKISALGPGSRYVIKAEVIKISSKRSFRRRMSVTEALVKDDTGSLVITWFNQPYLEETIKSGRVYLFAGPVKFYKTLQMQSPQWELEKEQTVHTGRIVPVYSLTDGIYPKYFRSLLKNLLDKLPGLPEHLPAKIIDENTLYSFDKALRGIHFPKDQDDADEAKKRLSFDELLFYELKILQHKKSLIQSPARSITTDQGLIKKFESSLPFQLTKGQKKASAEILADMAKPHPANRMLAGDVGSGKTVVAAQAILQTLNSGQNVALMVPTEILAGQHFQTFTKLPIIADYRIVLLTRSKKLIWKNEEVKAMGEGALLERSAPSQAALFIGTHSLIQTNADIDNLGLVVLDEQHRFGVNQRAALARKNSENEIKPHLLSMTATPIPRSLALTLYGDLEISRITEMPIGRKKIITKLVGRLDRKKTYDEVEKQIKSGRQIFVVCPLIDPSDKMGFKSAKEEHKKIETEIFPKYKAGLLHGKLKQADKDDVIKKFAEGKLDILVATTVVEVGVDFPNATVMMIEGAERFGLAQLHQLRGRVGRADHQSYCYLLPENTSVQATERLYAMTQESNGFALAELDLKLRGPGDMYGRIQSGFPQFDIADIFNFEMVRAARDEADNILSGKYEISKSLERKINNLQKELHLE